MFPLFSQMKAARGSISSADPSLFELEGGLQPDVILDKDIRERIPDESRALDTLQKLTGDRILGKDRQASKNEFIGGEQPALVGLSHNEALVSLAIGTSNAALCKKFLIDARNIASSGFALSAGRQKYWEGLRSSDIDRRNRAQRSSLRWLIGM